MDKTTPKKLINLLFMLFGVSTLLLSSPNLDDPIVLDSIRQVQPTCGLDNGILEFFVQNPAGLNYSIDNGQSFSTSPLFEDLPIGDYAIVITDGLDCTILRTVQLTNGPQVEIADYKVSCNEQAAVGNIELEVTNGTLPFKYIWEGPNGFSSTNRDLFGVNPGEYHVTITDAIDCRVSQTIEISACCGSATGIQISCINELFLNCGDPSNDNKIMQWIDQVYAEDIFGNDLDIQNNFDQNIEISCEEVYTVNFSALDQCGNVVNCSSNIVMADLDLPMIDCPANTTIEFVPNENLNNIEAWISSVTGSDNCGEVKLTNDFNPSMFQNNCALGSTFEVNFVSKDHCDNIATCSASITIEPAPSVEIYCQPNLVLSCNEGDIETQIQEWLDKHQAIDDNGATLQISHDFEFNTAYECNEELVVTFSSKDYCDNILFCESRISIHDNEAPTINCADDLILSASSNTKEEDILQWMSLMEATDNCELEEFTNDLILHEINFDCGMTGTYPVQFIAVDKCGNVTPCNKNIIIEQTDVVLLNIPTTQNFSCDDNLETLIQDWLSEANAFDQDGNPIVINNNFEELNIDCTTELEVTFSYTNICGDLVFEYSTINVDDNEPPSIDCPEAIDLYSYEIPNYDFELWLSSFVADDNCNGISIDHDFELNDVYGVCENPYFIGFTATDDCGNIESCVAQINILDALPPQISCPSDIYLDALDPNVKEKFDAHLSKVIHSTNSIVSFEYSPDFNPNQIGTSFIPRDIEVTAIATDHCDRFVTCTFNLFIESEFQIFIPSVFTPNDDNNNDMFTVYGNDYLTRIVELTIYDRFGNRMEYIENAAINFTTEGWDGKFQNRECETGVYAYHTVVEDVQGILHEFNGTVTLLR